MTFLLYSVTLPHFVLFTHDSCPGSCQTPDALLLPWVSGRPEGGGTEGAVPEEGGLISLLMTGSTNRMETTSPRDTVTLPVRFALRLAGQQLTAPVRPCRLQ